MKKILITSVIYSLAAALSAQQVNAELKVLIEKAFTYFPKIKEAEQNITIVNERSQLVKLGYVPSLNASASYNYISPVGEATFPTGPTTTQTIQFQPNHNFNGGFNLNYVVYDFGRLQSNILKSKEELQMTKDNIEWQKSQLAAQVCQFYYGMIFLRQSLALEDSLLMALRENERLIQARLQNGDALQLDLLSIQGAIDQEEMKKIDLRSNYDKQVVFLEYLTGMAGYAPSTNTFDYTVQDQPLQQFLEMARTMNYEFTTANDRLRMIKTDLKLNHAGYLPYLNINGSAGFRNGYQPDINEFRFNYAVGGGITIPLLDAIRTKQQTRITKAQITQQELTLAAMENTYKKDIALVKEDITATGEKMIRLGGQLRTASEVLRLSRVRYTHGTITYLDLLNAAYNVQKVQLQQIQLEYQRCLSQIELARLSGVKFY